MKHCHPSCIFVLVMEPSKYATNKGEVSLSVTYDDLQIHPETTHNLKIKSDYEKTVFLDTKGLYSSGSNLVISYTSLGVTPDVITRLIDQVSNNSTYYTANRIIIPPQDMKNISSIKL